jgi:hypothetical protein
MITAFYCHCEESFRLVIPTEGRRGNPASLFILPYEIASPFRLRRQWSRNDRGDTLKKCHSREGGNLLLEQEITGSSIWILAYARMTTK